MQPRRPKRAAWVDTALLVSAVLLFGALALIRIGGSAPPAASTTTATTTTETQTVVAEQPTLVADAPAASAYPPPYPPPSFVPPPAEPSTYTLRPEDPFVAGICINGLQPSEIAMWTETADVVALGTVVDVQLPRWTTPDGTRPANPHADDEIIYTPVIVEVERYFKGEQPTQQIGVLARDGQIGQDRMDYCGDTRYIFEQGECVVLFLAAPQNWNETYKDLPLWEVGEHFSVAKDGQVTTGPRYGGSLSAPLPKVLADIDAALQP